MKTRRRYEIRQGDGLVTEWHIFRCSPGHAQEIGTIATDATEEEANAMVSGLNLVLGSLTLKRTKLVK